MNPPELPTLLVATLNLGKVREIREFLKQAPFRLVDLSGLQGVVASPEDGESFEANARQKACFYSAHTDWLVLADDSGLVVDALNGQPGVHSARYLSESASDEQRCRAILSSLKDVCAEKRSARFVCSLVLAHRSTVLHVCTGVVEGNIALEMTGRNGFGYDPIFIVSEKGRTMAELTPNEKLEVSHRGRALVQMRKYLLPKTLGLAD